MTKVKKDEVKSEDIEIKAIGEEEIKRAMETLKKYKKGKERLDQRVIDDEEWFKLRHWNKIRKEQSKEAIEPVSAWLLNCVLNKHADAMDNFPEANIVPREESDKPEAKILSSIIPLILEHDNFEDTYDRCWWRKLKSGTGVYGVFWDSSKLHGLGDISIRPMNIPNLFWEPGVDDIQKSANFFSTELVDNAALEAKHPELADKLKNRDSLVKQYIYEDDVDTSEKSLLVDWYYKKPNSKGRQILHYCKFVAGVTDVVLYATENDTEVPVTEQINPETGKTEIIISGEPKSETGWYKHGLYPFIFDHCFIEEGSPAGFGYIDICKSAQEYIDKMNQAIIENSLASATQRWFVRSDGAVNEEEYADFSKKFVHADSNLGEDSIREITTQPLPGIYVDIMSLKIDEMKETSGNRDVSTGGTTSGVTAASAIAAMQEQAGKLSRDSSKAAHRAFKQIIEQVIELIREFYSLPRQFRVIGKGGEETFITYTNAKIQDQELEAFGEHIGYRTPVFDIEVHVQNETEYNKTSYNELALQLYEAGIFNPELADQANQALEIMDFKGKNEVQGRVQQNAKLLSMMQMYQQMAIGIAQKYEPETAARMIADATGKQQKIATGGKAKLRDAETERRNNIVEKAKAEARSKAQPR